MNKYIIGIGVGLAIIIAGLFFISKNKAIAPSVLTPASQNEAPESSVVTMPTVVYTNDGFSPAELTVQAGTTVTFINQSDAPMWIASAVHPTHLLYPEFDEKVSVSKGGSYSFTFNKTGEHPYHNHMLLGKYGKIIVE